MKFTVYSYRYAQEILEHSTNLPAWDEIIDVVTKAPLFIYPGKSKSNARLDVVQQCLNTWFDRALAVDCGWLYHPLATAITNSRLAADFRKSFPNITIQSEVQFGNMSRWYSDIFKLQTAYSQSLIHLGLSIVPMGALARRIDSNVASFERVVRELPSANLSITLPILVIGIEPDEDTTIVDLRKTGIPLERMIKKDGKRQSSEKNRYRVVNALFSGANPHSVTDISDTGPMASPIVDVSNDEED
ncbi:MAG TPA: BglII/BstYI family type II restriction endonuclease [Allosphingosinicella sp.]